MTTPIPSLNSSINIRLNLSPKIADPVLYEALLDIHSAIEALVRKYDSITSGLSPGTSPGIVAETIIAGDGVTEAGGININGTNHNATSKVTDLFGVNQSQLILHRHSTLYAPGIIGARSNSNTSAHAAVIAGQELLFSQAVGYAGTSYKSFGAFSFKVDSTGTISDTSAPGKFVLSITPDGSVTPVDVLTVLNNGDASFSGSLAASSVTATSISATSVTSTSLTATSLVATRIPLVGVGGLLIDDADLTFVTDTLTSAKLKSPNPLQQNAVGAASVAGNAVLVAGTVTVSTTAVKTASIVSLTRKASGGTVGAIITYTIINGTSFTITSDNVLDTSTLSWLITDTY